MSAATVYRVWAQLEEYRSLLFDLPNDELPPEARGFFGKSKAAEWTAPPVFVDNLAMPNPDVWFLAQGARVFVFTPDVLERLEPFVSMSGELLPLRHDAGFLIDSQSFHALNILNLVDAIDMTRNDFQQLMVYPDFVQHRLGEPTLFIVPQLVSQVFCVDWDDVDDSFKRRVENLGITGLGFEEVWSSDTGPRDINLMRE